MKEEKNLSEFIEIFLKGKWIILTICITFLMIVFVINIISSPVYVAKTTILISPSSVQSSIFGSSRLSPIFGGSDEIETHIAILKSFNIAQGVTERLPADIFERITEKIRKEKLESLRWPFNLIYKFFIRIKNVNDTPMITPNLDDSIEIPPYIQNNISKIKNSLNVSAVKDANMIEISCETIDPELSAEIANTTADVFIDKFLVINRSNASEATKFIEEQLQEKEKELAEQEKELQNIRNNEGIENKELLLTNLERTIRVSENIYLLLLEKYQESRINEVMEFIDIRVIDKAVAPAIPIKPRKILNLAIGGFLGLILGTLLVFFLEYMDHTIRNTKDIEHILHLPVLGVIPIEKSGFVKKERNR